MVERSTSPRRNATARILDRIKGFVGAARSGDGGARGETGGAQTPSLIEERHSRRRTPRQPLRLPVTAQGFQGHLAPQGFVTHNTPWSESTVTHDVSVRGVSLSVSHPVAVGQVLVLDLPLPARLRRYDFEAAMYRTYAIVRHTAGANGRYRVGAAFNGKTPPAGFGENPSGSFRMATILPDVRHSPRHEARVPAIVRTTVPAREEATITENLSTGGVLLPTTLPLAPGEVVRLDIDGGAVRTNAVVRARFMGRDGVTRLSLSFAAPESAEPVRALLKRLGAA